MIHLKLIGMSGKIASGKDYTANLLMEEIMCTGELVNFISFADGLRIEVSSVAEFIEMGLSDDEIAEVMKATPSDIKTFRELMADDDLFTRTHDPKLRTKNVRLIMQHWGTNVRRRDNDNYWVDKLVDYVNLNSSQYDYIVVTDVRFPNEANAIINNGGVLVRCQVDEDTRLNRIKGRGTTVTSEQLTHVSETALDDYDFPFIIDTNRDGDLDRAVKYINEN